MFFSVLDVVVDVDWGDSIVQVLKISAKSSVIEDSECRTGLIGRLRALMVRMRYGVTSNDLH